MQRGKITVPIAVLVLLLTVGVPAVFADTTGFSWSPDPISPGGSTVVTVHLTSTDCPPGDAYSAGVLVTDPNGNKYVIVAADACGTDKTFTYPSDFHVLTPDEPTPDTATCGTYFGGMDFNVFVPGNNDPINSGSGIQGSFTVTCPTGVPQFPLGLAALLALIVPLLLVIKGKFGLIRPAPA